MQASSAHISKIRHPSRLNSMTAKSRGVTNLPAIGVAWKKPAFLLTSEMWSRKKNPGLTSITPLVLQAIIQEMAVKLRIVWRLWASGETSLFPKSRCLRKRNHQIIIFSRECTWCFKIKDQIHCKIVSMTLHSSSNTSRSQWSSKMMMSFSV